MSNMSYCRFQNTDTDLADCEGVLGDLLGRDPDIGPLSHEELAAANRLVKRCRDIIAMVAEWAASSDDDSPALTDSDIERALSDANAEAEDND